MSRKPRTKAWRRTLPYGTRAPKQEKRKLSQIEYELLSTQHWDIEQFLKSPNEESLGQVRLSHAAVEIFRQKRTSAEIP
jgi:hypothetical protein